MNRRRCLITTATEKCAGGLLVLTNQKIDGVDQLNNKNLGRKWCFGFSYLSVMFIRTELPLTKFLYKTLQ